jgi:hypothetical protein
MSTHTIITIFRKKLIVCHVKPGAKKPIFDVREYGWDDKTLDIVLTKVRDLYKTKSIRILFTREVSYVLRVSVPRDLDLESKRQTILDKLLERVPEILENRDFDFVSLQNDPLKEDQDVLAFAPVGELSMALRKAVASANIAIEASEPEELAKTRDVNPLIGLAMKEDIKGKDETVLNLQFNESIGEQKADTAEDAVSEEHQKKRGSGKLKNVIMVVFTILLFTAAIFVALWQFKIITLPSGG